MALNVDNMQGCAMGLAAVNFGNTQSFILDATVNGANTFATLYSRVAANIAATTVTNEANQFGNVKILPGLIAGNRAGTLTDSRLNGLTTVAAVRALFTADYPGLPSTYQGNLPE